MSLNGKLKLHCFVVGIFVLSLAVFNTLIANELVVTRNEDFKIIEIIKIKYLGEQYAWYI